MAKYYMWFVLAVAGLAGVVRVLLPRRLAELQMERFRGSDARSRARRRSLLFAVMALIFGGFYFMPWGHQSWIVIGTIFPLLGAAEIFFQAQYPSIDALVFQSRLLGILYLGLAAASYVLLSRL